MFELDQQRMMLVSISEAKKKNYKPLQIYWVIEMLQEDEFSIPKPAEMCMVSQGTALLSSSTTKRI